jgi:hypothetical protein
MPLVFSPLDPRILYFAGNVVFKTLNGGHSWQVISPDLTRASYDVPANLGAFTALDPEHGRHRGVIYTIAPSFTRLNLLWVGTDDGLIHVTHDGGRTWKNVTPPALTPWSKVSLLEASHSDTLVAYAAVNRFRLDDLHPHIFRTRDGGRTWAEITAGIPDHEVVNAVREDPVRRGLLFAGSERAVYVSFDDGDHWQSLRLDMPATAIRDLVIHDSDLVVGTHGRSFWILDDITPLRQLGGPTPLAAVVLFRPAGAVRVRWNRNPDTPLPPDEPAGKNPPDGAILDYYLKSPATGPVTLEVLDRQGRVVRRFSSADQPAPPESTLNIPTWWIRPPQLLSVEAGMHRFVWDLHYPPPASLSHEYPISATYRDTPREPRGPWVLPRSYTVRLTVSGKAYTQPLTVRMDPRVRTPAAGLALQLSEAQRLVVALRQDSVALGEVRQRKAGQSGPSAALDSLDAAFARLNGQLARAYGVIEGSDGTPTTQAVAAVGRLERELADLLAQWSRVRP